MSAVIYRTSGNKAPRHAFWGAAIGLAAIASGCSLLADLDVGVRTDAGPSSGDFFADSGLDGRDGSSPGDAATGAIEPAQPDGSGPGGSDPTPCHLERPSARDPVSGHCLIYFDTPQTWATASATCQTLAVTGRLASVGGAGENESVHSLVGSGPAWIGATDQAAEGVFIWTDTTPWSYQNWLAGEPSTVFSNNDCVVLDGAKAGRWYAWTCHAPIGFVCEHE